MSTTLGNFRALDYLELSPSDPTPHPLPPPSLKSGPVSQRTALRKGKATLGRIPGGCA